jgi:N-acetylneuraminate synthase
LKIGKYNIGPGQCFIIAEVAQAHDGSIGMAHAFVNAVADAGADAVKFQTHIAAAESTYNEPWRIKFSLQDNKRYDYWKRMEFTKDQWCDLAELAKRKNLEFLSSPFSFEALEMLEKVGMPAWKVASGEVNNLPLLERMAKTKKPVLLSSGLSSWSELDNAVDLLKRFSSPFCIFQCTTEYPVPPEKIGLNLLEDIRSRYGCPVGLSDHSGMIFSSLAAAVLGAEMVEVHVTFSKHAFGPDVEASLTIENLKELVKGVRFIEKILSHPIDKNILVKTSTHQKYMFSRSIVAKRDLKKGILLTEKDLTLKKPGGGLPPCDWWRILGRQLRRNLRMDQKLNEEDLE